MSGPPLQPSQRAPGLLLGRAVDVPFDAEIGAYVVLHDGVVLGTGCFLGDHVVLGKQPTLGPRSTSGADEWEPTALGDLVAVLAGAVVFTGVRLGERSVVGDQANVRERSRIGAASVIGQGTGIENDVSIGERVQIQSQCYLSARTVVEDDAFLGPRVTTTNDNTMSRHGPEVDTAGPVFGRGCRIGGGVVACPGVRIGEEAFVAAGAVIARDIPDRAVAMGVPARVVGEVADSDLLERWR